MRISRIAVLGASLLVGLVVTASGAGSAGTATILKADTLAGVSGPYVGTPNPIRGVNGGGVAWDIAKGEAVLTADGVLEVKVEGLVLATTGTNPVTSFRAIVSCQAIVDGAAAVVNVSTAAFPATTTGDSKIAETVSLPSKCFAPIVFVTSPGGSWFAVTGV
ncbi:MAG: hypothetical protein ABWY83_02300 [Actinomycetota bacterium]